MNKELSIFTEISKKACSENMCWNLMCTTCGSSDLMKEFSGVVFEDKVLDRFGRNNSYSDQKELLDKIGVIKTRELIWESSFPDWLGHIGLLLSAVSEVEKEELILTKQLLPQFLDLVPGGEDIIKSLEELKGPITRKELEMVEEYLIKHPINKNYTIQDFRRELGMLLSKASQKPKNVSGEGLVYEGGVASRPNKKNFVSENAIDFRIWLSFFTVADFIIYTYFKEDYLQFKKEFGTIRFDFCVSGKFRYKPDFFMGLGDNGQGGSFEGSFRKIFPIFNKELNVVLKKIGVSPEEMEGKILQDKDVICGMVGMQYVKAYGKDLLDYYTFAPEPKLGGAMVWKAK